MKAVITIHTRHGLEIYRAVLLGPHGVVAERQYWSVEYARAWLRSVNPRLKEKSK